MSSTATATRGITATGMNLSVFSHPPLKRELLGNTTLEAHLMPVIEPMQPQSPEQISDDEDIFNLDMVTMEMNFEQAYSMYAQIQRKNALLEVEQLQKAQQLNHHSHKHKHKHNPNPLSHESVQHAMLTQTQPFSSKDWGQTPRQYPGEAHTYTKPTTRHLLLLLLLLLHIDQNNHNPHNIDVLQRSAVISDVTGSLISPPGEPIEAFANIYAGQQAQLTRLETEFINEEAEEADQFFSTTESSALDKFLDNLAFSSEVNPLEYYQQNQPKIPHMFEMQTMGNGLEQHQQDQLSQNQNQNQNQNRDRNQDQDQDQQLDFADTVKRDIVNAFQHHESHDLKSFSGITPSTNTQLLTPDTTMSRLNLKREHDDFSASSAFSTGTSELGVKKRRKSVKPLLTLTQKRLNHSHLEQKRRLLCKEAYDRCLRLVTNVDDYKNDLVSAGSTSSSRKKSKRKQLNKDGLPNLSKHSALLKISNEICKIQSKNEQLRMLLGEL